MRLESASLSSGDAQCEFTSIEFLSRLTATESTPSTRETTFSTLAWHAAQLMPVTAKCRRQEGVLRGESGIPGNENELRVAQL